MRIVYVLLWVHAKGWFFKKSDPSIVTLHGTDVVLQSKGCKLIVPLPYSTPRLSAEEKEALSKISACLDKVESFSIEKTRFWQKWFSTKKHRDLVQSEPNDTSAYTCVSKDVSADELAAETGRISPGKSNVDLADQADRIRDLSDWRVIRTVVEYAGPEIMQRKFFGKGKAATAQQVCNTALVRAKAVYDVVFAKTWKDRSSKRFVYSMVFHPERLLLGEDYWHEVDKRIQHRRSDLLSCPEMKHSSDFFNKYDSFMSCFATKIIASSSVEPPIPEDPSLDEVDLCDTHVCASEYPQHVSNQSRLAAASTEHHSKKIVAPYQRVSTFDSTEEDVTEDTFDSTDVDSINTYDSQSVGTKHGGSLQTDSDTEPNWLDSIDSEEEGEWL